MSGLAKFERTYVKMCYLTLSSAVFNDGHDVAGSETEPHVSADRMKCVHNVVNGVNLDWWSIISIVACVFRVYLNYSDLFVRRCVDNRLTMLTGDVHR